jgi:hypothetical protein
MKENPTVVSSAGLFAVPATIPPATDIYANNYCRSAKIQRLVGPNVPIAARFTDVPRSSAEAQRTFDVSVRKIGSGDRTVAIWQTS